MNASPTAPTANLKQIEKKVVTLTARLEKCQEALDKARSNHAETKTALATAKADLRAAGGTTKPRTPKVQTVTEGDGALCS